MQKYCKSLVAGLIVAVPLLAGGLFLKISDAAGTPEAKAKHAVLVTQVTACSSPEKTTVTGAAEGIVDGMRKTIPLEVMALNRPGSFAVAKQWPDEGTWVVKMTAT